MTNSVKEEFTPWCGGAQSIFTRGRMVECVYRNGLSVVANADNIRWTHFDFDAPFDIIGYRILSEPRASENTSSAEQPISHDDAITIREVRVPKGYEKLFDVLVAALEQASAGKGKDRHASDGVAFEDQPMSSISRTLESVDGMLYQASKKARESRGLPGGRAQAEIYGAINYLAGVAIAYDTWAKRAPK